MKFEWDAAKAAENRRKHGVSFDEATEAFRDHDAVLLFDERHSDKEDRYIIIGHSRKGRLLTVVYAERDGKARIISAWKATKAEAAVYGQA
jgi:uncharacterized DUF497 family protein